MTVLRDPSLLLAFVAGRRRRGVPHDHAVRVAGCFRCDLSADEAAVAAGVRDVISAHAAAIGDTEALPAPVPSRGGAASPTRPAPTPPNVVMERLARRSVWQATPQSGEIGDCRVWIGPRSDDGYGQVTWVGWPAHAHRVSWVAAHGTPPAESPSVLHRCDNPPCWRLDHLFLGTHTQNMRDMVTKGRHANQAKTCCRAGHPFTEANTYMDPKGARRCRTCNRLAAARSAARRAHR